MCYVVQEKTRDRVGFGFPVRSTLISSRLITVECIWQEKRMPVFSEFISRPSSARLPGCAKLDPGLKDMQLAQAIK